MWLYRNTSMLFWYQHIYWCGSNIFQFFGIKLKNIQIKLVYYIKTLETNGLASIIGKPNYIYPQNVFFFHQKDFLNLVIETQH